MDETPSEGLKRDGLEFRKQPLKRNGVTLSTENTIRMQKPNFLIIGVPKAGTTSLYHYLKQHPDVFMSPVKEPYFFAFEGMGNEAAAFNRDPLPSYSTEWDHYCALFSKAGKEKVVGEASTSYLYNPSVPARIRHYLPNAKMVAILRNPIDRAFSNYLFRVRTGTEVAQDFSEALRQEQEDEEERTAQGWRLGLPYRRTGLYAEQLERYYRIFDAGQLNIQLFEDLESDPVGVLGRIYDFLDLDPDFLPDTTRAYNAHGEARSRRLHDFLAQPSLPKTVLKVLLPASIRIRMRVGLRERNTIPTPSPELPLQIRSELTDYYRDDITRLQDLIGRDLSHWLDNGLQPVSGELRE